MAEAGVSRHGLRGMTPRIASIAALLCFAASPCLAAGKIAYGSRVGMQVTIRSMAGIGTAHARINVEHTAEDAKEFCVEYSDDKSDDCVKRTLRDTRLNDVLVGNCSTGRFVSLFGEQLQFLGRRKKKELELGEARYVMIGADRQPLDSSMASGYSYDLEQFKALCPGRVDEIE